MKNYNCITFSNSCNLHELNQIFTKQKRNFEFSSIAVCINRKKVLGIITLGDIRRFLQQKKDLEQPVVKFLNKNFFSIKETDLNSNLNFKINNIITNKPNIKKIFNVTILLNKNKEFIKVIDLNLILNNPNYKNICVVGMGYVGLSLSAHLLIKNNIKIIGVDHDPKKINLLKRGKINFYEKNLDGILKKNIKNKNIIFKSNIKKNEAQVYIICVGSEFNKNKISNENLKDILKKISKLLNPNDLVILRGTLQVGFSRNVAKNILESKNKLICGKGFYLSYCPERIVEGDAINELENLPQLVSGYSNNCLDTALNFLRNFFSKRLVLNSLEEAEIIKLATNSYRDLTFAFSNELSRICSIYKINTRNLISNASSDYPRGVIPFPSIGVGGSCLVKDPILFTKLINNKNKGYKLGNLSREINNLTINHISKKIIKLSKNSISKKVLILGMAFKGYPETSDTRSSPSLALGQILQRKKFEIYFHDKIIKKNKYSGTYYRNQILDKIDNLKIYDFILLLNNNDYYSELITNKLEKNNDHKRKFLLDVWNITNKDIIQNYGYQYLNI